MGMTETIFIIFYAIIVISVLIFGSMFIILRRKTPERKNIPYYDSYEHAWKCEIDGRTEIGCIEYVVSEFIQDGLIYHFYINDTLEHEHTFEAVIEAVIKEYKTFSIREYKHEYSEQEIKMLNKLVEKLKEKESEA